MYVPTIKLESDNVMLNEVVVKASAYIHLCPNEHSSAC